MKKGYLSQYFDGVAIKRLSTVEVDLLCSNQHEFNGVQQLKNILGDPSEKHRYDAKFIYLSDEDEKSTSDDGFLTWYDARQNHPTRSECRLYFPKNIALESASGGDLLLIAKKPDNSLLAIIAKNRTTIEKQILWLFGIDEFDGITFSVRENLDTEHDKVDYTLRFILEEIGIEIQDDQNNTHLDKMLGIFKGTFPTTLEFSSFARSTLPDVSSCDNPDKVLLLWMEQEETLFKTLERHILEEKIKNGFGDNIVDGFLKLSLSVQNRRKSRAGSALENHLEYIFIEHKIKYSREKVTENKHKPDFIFPSITNYHDASFPNDLLTMLAAKTTCKERWRQIRNEADRIQLKHLLTLEPSISENSTTEMQYENVQLVIPSDIHKSFTSKQQEWLICLGDFLELIQKIQKDSPFN